MIVDSRKIEYKQRQQNTTSVLSVQCEKEDKNNTRQ